MNRAPMKAKSMYRKNPYEAVNRLLWFGISLYVRDVLFFAGGVLFARLYVF